MKKRAAKVFTVLGLQLLFFYNTIDGSKFK